MNNLPAHRQLLWGRTHGKTWEPTDSDPVTFYPASRVSKLAGYVMAVSIGASLAFLVAYSI